MPRRRSITIVSLVLLVDPTGGCTSSNPAFALDGDPPGLTDATDAPASSSSDTNTPTTGPGSASNSASAATTDAATSSGDPTASDSSGGPTTGMLDTTQGAGSTGPADTDASSSGGPNECMDAVVGEPARLEIKKDGQVLLACGGAISLTNAFAKFSGSTLKLYNSGTCMQTGPLYEVTGVNFAIKAKDLGEGCSDVRIEWATAPPCEVTGFGITLGDNPVYVGAFGRLLGPTGYTSFSSEPLFDCGCTVDDAACCEHLFDQNQQVYQPGAYTLAFPGAMTDIAAPAAIVGSVDGSDYLFTNLRSQVHGSCDAAPSHVWLDIRWWAMASD